MNRIIFIVLMGFAPLILRGQSSYNKDNDLLSKQMEQEKKEITSKQRPAEAYTFQSLLNTSRHSPLAIVKQLKQTWWVVDSDYTKKGVRNITLSYTYNPACRIELSFKPGQDAFFSYESPYGIEGDKRLYNDAKQRLLDKNCKMNQSRESYGIGESYSASAGDLSVMVCIAKYTDENDRIKKIQYILFSTEGL